MISSFLGFHDIVDLLLQYNANVNLSDNVRNIYYTAIYVIIAFDSLIVLHSC